MNLFDKSNPLSERVKSPFYGSFIISWFIWNWRIVLTILLFSKKDYGNLNVVQYIATHYLNICDCLKWENLMQLILKLQRDKEHKFSLLIATQSFTGMRIGDTPQPQIMELQ